MIEKQEIAELARELSLDLHVVEKDYDAGRKRRAPGCRVTEGR